MLRTLWSKLSRIGRPTPARQRPQPRLYVEHLEERAVPTTTRYRPGNENPVPAKICETPPQNRVKIIGGQINSRQTNGNTKPLQRTNCDTSGQPKNCKEITVTRYRNVVEEVVEQVVVKVPYTETVQVCSKNCGQEKCREVQVTRYREEIREVVRQVTVKVAYQVTVTVCEGSCGHKSCQQPEAPPP